MKKLSFVEIVSRVKLDELLFGTDKRGWMSNYCNVTG